MPFDGALRESRAMGWKEKLGLGISPLGISKGSRQFALEGAKLFKKGDLRGTLNDLGHSCVEFKCGDDGDIHRDGAGVRGRGRG